MFFHKEYWVVNVCALEQLLLRAPHGDSRFLYFLSWEVAGGLSKLYQNCNLLLQLEKFNFKEHTQIARALTCSLKSNERPVTKIPLSWHIELVFLNIKNYENFNITLKKRAPFYRAFPTWSILNELKMYVWMYLFFKIIMDL